MSKKEEQPDRLKQFISWVDGDREPTPVCAPLFALSFTIKVNIFLKKVTGLFFYPIDLFSCVAYDEAK